MRTRSVWIIASCVAALGLSAQSCGIDEFTNPKRKTWQYDARWGVPVGYANYVAKELMDEMITNVRLEERQEGELVLTQNWQETYKLSLNTVELNDIQEDFFIYIDPALAGGRRGGFRVSHQNIMPYSVSGDSHIDSVVLAHGQMRLELFLPNPLDMAMTTTLPALHNAMGPMAIGFERAQAPYRTSAQSMAGYSLALSYSDTNPLQPLFLLKHLLSVYPNPAEPLALTPMRVRMYLENQQASDLYGRFAEQRSTMAPMSFDIQSVEDIGITLEAPDLLMSITNSYGLPVVAHFQGASLANAQEIQALEGRFFEQGHLIHGVRNPHQRTPGTTQLPINRNNSNFAQALGNLRNMQINLPITFDVAPKHLEAQYEQHFVKASNGIGMDLSIEQPLYGKVQDMVYTMSFSSDFIDPETKNNLNPYVDTANFRILVANGMPLEGRAEFEFMQGGVSTYRMEKVTAVVAPEVNQRGRSMGMKEKLSNILLEKEALEYFLKADEIMIRFYFSSPIQAGKPMAVRMAARDEFRIKLALITDVQGEISY